MQFAPWHGTFLYCGTRIRWFDVQQVSISAGQRQLLEGSYFLSGPRDSYPAALLICTLRGMLAWKSVRDYLMQVLCSPKWPCVLMALLQGVDRLMSAIGRFEVPTTRVIHLITIIIGRPLRIARPRGFSICKLLLCMLLLQLLEILHMI